MTETPVLALEIARNPWELEMLRLFRQVPEEQRAGALAELRALAKEQRRRSRKLEASQA